MSEEIDYLRLLDEAEPLEAPLHLIKLKEAKSKIYNKMKADYNKKYIMKWRRKNREYHNAYMRSYHKKRREEARIVRENASSQ